IRDLDEMRNAGFKALARRLAVSHAWTWPVAWGGEVEVFGTRVRHGQLIHADKHGFVIIPPDAQKPLTAAVRFLDDAECAHLLPASRGAAGRRLREILRAMKQGDARFAAAV